MAEGQDTPVESGVGQGERPEARVTWFAWAWVALVVAAALAEILDLVDLRLALDFQRYL